MMFLVVMPILIPLFQNKGLSMQNIFELQAYFSLIVALLEVPSGYFSDMIGRKMTIMIASFFFGLSYTVLNFSQSIFDLYLFETLIAVAVSFFSGTNIALLYDSLNQIDDDRDVRTRAMGNISFSLVFSESIASILAFFIIGFGLEFVLKIQMFTAWIPLIISFFLIDPPRIKMQKNHLENVKDILKFIFSHDKMVTLIFCNIIIWSLATYFAVWIHQKYWQEQQIDIKNFGLLWASFNLIVAITSKNAHRIEKKIGAKITVALIPITSIIGMIGMGYFGGIIGIFISSGFQISRGLNSVILKDALNWRLPSEFRATANSLHSLIFRIVFMLFGPLVGYSVDRQGIEFTTLTLAAIFSIFFILLIIPLINKIKIISK